MVTPILLPQQGNTVETCLILEWKKKEGEEIKKGEVICEVETDKAVFEIESPSDGVLLKRFFNEGDDVRVLTNIAVVGDEGESYDEFNPNSSKSNFNGAKEEQQVEENTNINLSVTVNENIEKDNLIKDGSSLSKIKISPRAKKLANQLKVSTRGIKGTGPGNRIMEKDIIVTARNMEPLTLAAGDLVNEVETRPVTGSGIGNRITTDDIKNKAPIYSFEEESIKVVPIRGIRKLIAERMLESLKNSAQLTLNSSADATALLNLRKRFKNSSIYKEFQSITINDLIHYAVIKTLPGQPELNSLLVRDKIEYYNKIHLGFAVDTPRGLMVPVIKNAQNLNLLKLSHEARRLAAASLSGKIDTEELSGATFTVTNLGSLGIESFTPVLNLPQTGILGINTIALKPIDRGNGVEFIPHISFSLTVDHRAIDGAVGARFLQSLANTLLEIDLVITSDIMRK